MFTLKTLPSTLICGFKRPKMVRQKWLILENGEPVTTPAGRGGSYGYNESSEEKAMREKLARHFTGQIVVSRPDIATDEQRARFEIHLETEQAAAPVVAEAAPEILANQMELLRAPSKPPAPSASPSPILSATTRISPPLRALSAAGWGEPGKRLFCGLWVCLWGLGWIIWGRR